MATLSNTRAKALGLESTKIILAPTQDDVDAGADHQDLGAAVLFPIGEPGDSFVIAGTAGKSVHVLAGGDDVEADATSPVFATGIGMTLPDGCTHVSLLEAEADVFGCAYPSKVSPG